MLADLQGSAMNFPLCLQWARRILSTQHTPDIHL